jgi:hypothetical protein
MNAYKTTLFQENSAAVYSFVVYLNAAKVPQGSQKFNVINKIITDKSNSNLAKSATDEATSEIKTIYANLDQSRVEQLFGNVNAETRMCVGLNSEYVVNSIMNCDMLVSLESIGADGSSFEVAGFASVNVGLGVAGQDISNPADAMFNIDVLCGDLSLRGTGFTIIRFLKSIIAKLWHDVNGNPLDPSYYGIYLESVNVPNTINFYEKNHFTCLFSCQMNDHGLFPHYWGIVHNLEEMNDLSAVYSVNHNLSYKNLMRDKDSMNWMYTGGKKKRKNKKTKKRKNKKVRKNKKSHHRRR